MRSKVDALFSVCEQVSKAPNIIHSLSCDSSERCVLRGSVTWICFGKPAALCDHVGVFLSAQHSPLLRGVENVKHTSSGCERRSRKATAGFLGETSEARAPSPPAAAAPRTQTWLKLFIFISSHGRVSPCNALSGASSRFPWEYTVLSVCCYHLPVFIKEAPWSQSPASERPEV